MSPQQESRHTALVNAGWHYDAAQDRYQAPGDTSPSGRWYNLAAAWLAHQAMQAAPPPAEPPGPGDARATKAADDPRRSKPQ